MATERLWKNVIIVGDSGCGKMSLYRVFIYKEFPEKYTPVVLEKWLADIQVDTIPVELELRYVACQESYDRLRPLSYPGTDVIILCFSIDSPKSLNNIQYKWHPEVRRYCPEVPVILVGNKRDIVKDETVKAEMARTGQVPVKWEEGQQMAKKIGAKAFLECSAKKQEGVREVFETAARVALKKDKSFCRIL